VALDAFDGTSKEDDIDDEQDSNVVVSTRRQSVDTPTAGFLVRYEGQALESHVASADDPRGIRDVHLLAPDRLDTVRPTFSSHSHGIGL
jgi:hypothetical protein